MVIKKGGTWRDIYGIDEKVVASLVREDKVDILVELTGHTANNKLGVLASHPAPVQVTLANLLVIILVDNAESRVCFQALKRFFSGHMDWLSEYNWTSNN